MCVYVIVFGSKHYFVRLFLYSDIAYRFILVSVLIFSKSRPNDCTNDGKNTRIYSFFGRFSICLYEFVVNVPRDWVWPAREHNSSHPSDFIAIDKMSACIFIWIWCFSFIEVYHLLFKLYWLIAWNSHNRIVFHSDNIHFDTWFHLWSIWIGSAFDAN